MGDTRDLDLDDVSDELSMLADKQNTLFSLKLLSEIQEGIGSQMISSNKLGNDKPNGKGYKFKIEKSAEKLTPSQISCIEQSEIKESNVNIKMTLPRAYPSENIERIGKVSNKKIRIELSSQEERKEDIFGEDTASCKDYISIRKSDDDLGHKDTIKNNYLTHASDTYESNTKPIPSSPFHSSSTCNKQVIKNSLRQENGYKGRGGFKPSYIPGPAGKLPILTLEERRELFNREAERELRYERRIHPTQSTSQHSFKSQIDKNLNVSDEVALAAAKLTAESVAWKNMLEIYPQYKDCKSNFVNMPNLTGAPFKIPSLMVLIDKFKKMDRGAGCVFKNCYGEIRGGIDKSVLEMFGSDIIHGTVIHLQKTSVFRPTIGSTFLNVTSKNVVCIFPESGVPKCIYNPNFSSPNEKFHKSSISIIGPDENLDVSSLKPSSSHRQDHPSNIFDNANFFDVPTEEELEKILASDSFDSDLNEDWSFF